MKKQILAIYLCAAVLSVILVAAAPARGQEALNIGLLRFEAIPAEDGIRLEWDVETELGTAGYTLKRSEGGNFTYLPDPGGSGNLFIFAEGGPAQGYNYEFTDTTAVRETTYTYQLIEITTSSGEQVQDEFTVIYHIDPTPTPITFSGNIGGTGGTSNQSSTATPTATVQPTATSLPQATTASAPPPTIVAPTPLPSPTAVFQPTSAPASNTPLQPTPNPLPDTAYPAQDTTAQETAVQTVGETVVSDLNPPYLEEASVEETTADAIAAVPEMVAPDPVEQMLESTSAVAYAQVIKGNLTDEQAKLQAKQPADGSPIVIEAAGVVTATTLKMPEMQEQFAQDDVENVDSSRLLLWVAFGVALIIFSVSVIGAIILYSRRPPLK